MTLIEEQLEVIKARNEVLNLKKEIIIAKYEYIINKPENKPGINKDEYKSEIAKLKEIKKEKISQLKEEYKAKKVEFKEKYQIFKNNVKANTKNDVLSKIEEKRLLSLTPIQDLEFANVNKEFTTLKKVKRNYKKYDNKAILTNEEKRDRKLNKLDYIVEHKNVMNAYKCGLKIKKYNYKINKQNEEVKNTYKEDVINFRCQLRFFDDLHYMNNKVKHIVKEDHLSLGRIIVTIFSVISLAFSLVYIRAIQQVVNTWTGLFMFMFILFGLISIFNVFRLKEAYCLKTLFVITILILTIVSGIILIIFTLTSTQRGIKFNLVYQGVALVCIVSVGYILGIISILSAYKREKREFEESSDLA